MPSRAQSKLTGGNEVGLYRPAIHVRWLYVYSRRGWKSGQKNLFLHVFLSCFRKTLIRQKLTCAVFYKIFGNIVLVMQRYIVQTIYRVDIGHIVSYRYHQERYRNFDISLSFRYRFNIGKTTSMLSSYFLFCR